MKAARWIGFIASRYVSRGRKNSPSPVFSVLGIATGVLALTVIIAVMNGFQLGFIESILEISSYHLRVESSAPGIKDDRLSEKIRGLPEVVSVLPFRELNVLVRARQGNPRGAIIRGVSEDALFLDRGLSEKLVIEDGYFDLGENGNIVLGAELARFLTVRVGDRVNLLSITGIIGSEEENERVYTITGIFRSGFYEYDLGWAFVNMETAEDLAGAGSIVLGIKIKNRWQDHRAKEEVRKVLSLSGINENDAALSSWRDYNRAFFGALRTEKLMMFILVGLIFIVVGLNIFQSQRRTVLERREEIGLLRALGASDRAVRLVFVWDGFIIGLVGAGAGLALGLLIAFNIQTFFSVIEGAVNFFIYVFNSVSVYLGGYAGADEFSVFSPRVFYIKEIPSRVIPIEVVSIFLFGFLSAISAAWFASGKVSGVRPAEVLRYE